MNEFIIVRPDGPQGTRPIQVVRRLDLLALAGRLVQRKDPVSTWLWGCLSEATRIAIDGPHGPGSDPALWKDLLVADVEGVAKGPAVYDANRFQDVKLPPTTTALLGSSPTGEDLVRLNRMVLAAAFQELRPNVLMDGGWLGKTDAILFVGTPGVHQLTVDLPGAETKEVTIQDTSAVRPLEVSIRWVDPASAAGAAGTGGRT
jgi:hypothetical protein